MPFFVFGDSIVKFYFLYKEFMYIFGIIHRHHNNATTYQHKIYLKHCPRLEGWTTHALFQTEWLCQFKYSISSYNTVWLSSFLMTLQITAMSEYMPFNKHNIFRLYLEIISREKSLYSNKIFYHRVFSYYSKTISW